MRFWVFLAIMITIFLLLKWYFLRGVGQATDSAIVLNVFRVLSIGSIVIGFPVMMYSYKDGMVGLTFLQNFIIGLMVSVSISELIVSLLFVFDDIYLLVQKFGGAGKDWAYDPEKRRTVKLIGLSLGAIPFGNFLYGITKGKYDYTVMKEVLYFDDLPQAFDGFTIAQFSDMHAGSFDSAEDVIRGINKIQETKADVILFTGDLVNDLEQEIIPYKDALKKLTAPFGKFSILGNHDYPFRKNLFPTEEDGAKNLASIEQHHADMDFKLLKNENVKLEKDGESIRLIGVENWGTGFIQIGDLDKAVKGVGDEEFKVLASHDPSHWEAKVKDHEKHVHLTLSGHTHGTQMGVEIGDFKWSPVQYFYKKWAGLYEEQKQYLYVNRGFGYIGFPGRVGIDPEITLIELRRRS